MSSDVVNGLLPEQKAEVLLEALPWLQEFAGALVVALFPYRVAQLAGLSDVIATGSKLRIAPARIPDSRRVRLERLYPGALDVLARFGRVAASRTGIAGRPSGFDKRDKGWHCRSSARGSLLTRRRLAEFTDARKHLEGIVNIDRGNRLAA